jgi:hypothetical protein
MLTVPVGDAPFALASTAIDRVLVSPAGTPAFPADPVTFIVGVHCETVKVTGGLLLAL